MFILGFFSFIVFYKEETNNNIFIILTAVVYVNLKVELFPCKHKVNITTTVRLLHGILYWAYSILSGSYHLDSTG